MSIGDTGICVADVVEGFGVSGVSGFVFLQFGLGGVARRWILRRICLIRFRFACWVGEFFHSPETHVV